jgi:pilus assembly protein CpaC
MRKSLNIVTGVLLLATVGTSAPPLLAGPPSRSPGQSQGLIAPDVGTNGVLKITDRGANQTKRLALGKGKSLLIEFPYDLRDVLVGDPDSVDAVVQTSNRVFMIAKKTGQTNAFFFDVNGQQVLTLEITVGADLSALDDLIRRLIPGSNVHTELAGNAIALVGSVRTPADSARAAEIATQFSKANSDQLQQTAGASTGGAAGSSTSVGFQGQAQKSGGAGDRPVINLLTIEGEDQVMLRVQVAEVQRTLLKQFGIDLAASVQAGSFSTGIVSGSATALGNLGLDAAGKGIISQNTNGTNGLLKAGSADIRYALRALERDGLIKTLAEPNLTAVSGETAKFLAGGEYPYTVCNNTNGCTVAFKEYGIGLAFTPVVMTEGRISLKIETEVSELSTDGAVGSYLALKKRAAKSTVELPSGGSIAMAGLISETTRQSIEGFPGLKDVPILGTLFRSREFKKDETELVIIVTPYTVRPTSPQNLARPTDGLASPTDMKANFLGHLNKIYGKGTNAPDGGLKGDHGFIVE